MIHPDIINAYGYARVYAQRHAIDACTDVAEYYGLPVATLAQFLVRMRIVAYRDAEQLQLIA